MICTTCRGGSHTNCPGGTHCFCQHRTDRQPAKKGETNATTRTAPSPVAGSDDADPA